VIPARFCRTIAIVAAATLIAAAPANLSATPSFQTPAPPDTTRRLPGFVTPDHWSRGALRRLAASGHLDVARASLAWPAPRVTVRASLERARQHAIAAGDSLSATLANAYLRRFDAERREHPGRLSLTPEIGVQTRIRRHELLAGHTVPNATGYAYSGPRPPRNRSALAATSSFLFSWRHFEAAMASESDRGSPLTEAWIGARFGQAHLWLGHRPLGFGPGTSGSIVLSSTTAFTGIGVDLTDGFRLPGFLTTIGPLRITQLLARMARSGEIEHPAFMATRISVAPSDRVVIGANRGAIFGGRGNLGLTPWRVLWLLLGQTDVPGKSSDFENQVVSVDMIVRPFERTPLILYGEWGFDDAGWAFIRVPGILLGATLARVPALPGLELGAEITHFARKCCGHPEWYWHGALPDGWTDRGTLLGHPLGGNGTEFALQARFERTAAGSESTFASRIYVRERGGENLFAPDRAGRSLGATVTSVLPLTRTGRFELRGELEHGSAWTRWGANAGLFFTF
jgi:hypothetical protein